MASTTCCNASSARSRVLLRSLSCRALRGNCGYQYELSRQEHLTTPVLFFIGSSGLVNTQDNEFINSVLKLIPG